MHQILRTNNDLYLGDITDFKEVRNKENFAFVSACKKTHCQRMGWKFNNTSSYKNHENYLYKKTDRWLSINWVDSRAKYFEMAGVDAFNMALDFIEKNLIDFDVLVHCAKGESRSPTLGLLYLSKRENEISSDNFSCARAEFEEYYSQYNPKGIADFVTKNWNKIN